MPAPVPFVVQTPITIGEPPNVLVIPSNPPPLDQPVHVAPLDPSTQPTIYFPGCTDGFCSDDCTTVALIPCGQVVPGAVSSCFWDEHFGAVAGWVIGTQCNCSIVQHIGALPGPTFGTDGPDFTGTQIAYINRSIAIFRSQGLIIYDYVILCGFINSTISRTGRSSSCPPGYVYNPRQENCSPYFPFEIVAKPQPFRCPPPGIVQLIHGVPVCMMDPPTPNPIPEAYRGLHRTSSDGVRVRLDAGNRISRPPMSNPFLNPTLRAPIPFVFKGCESCAGEPDVEELI